MLMIERIWWLLLFANACLTAYLIWRLANINSDARERDHQRRKSYDAVVSDVIGEKEELIAARKEYERKIEGLPITVSDPN